MPRSAGDLLVQSTAQDVLEHLALAFGERGEAGARLLLPLALRAFVGIAGERAVHGVEERLPGRALGEEILGTQAHRVNRGGDVAVPAQEQHWQGLSPACRSRPAQTRHPQVRHHATGARGRQALDELRC